MRQKIYSLLVLALAVTVASAAEPILKVPAEVKVPRGTFAIVKPETDCTSVKWKVLDPVEDGPGGIPPDLLRDPNACLLIYPGDWTFTVVFWGAKGDQVTDLATCQVVFGKGKPPPGPQPPPTPPGPVPPTDPLVLAFQAAYAAETDSDKATTVPRLATLYGQIATFTRTNKDIKTWKDVTDNLKSSAAILQVSGKCLTVQKAVQEALRARLAWQNALDKPMDEATRSQAASAFEAIAQALKEVK